MLTKITARLHANPRKWVAFLLDDVVGLKESCENDSLIVSMRDNTVHQILGDFDGLNSVWNMTLQPAVAITL